MAARFACRCCRRCRCRPAPPWLRSPSPGSRRKSASVSKVASSCLQTSGLSHRRHAKSLKVPKSPTSVGSGTNNGDIRKEDPMAVQAGINGFGRIGRNLFRAAHAAGADIDWVGVNDITDTKTLAQLVKYDSILGRFPGTVEATDTGLVVDGKELRVFSERDPGALPWSDVGADVVIESTGLFTDRDSASKHLDAGAKKVIISAPAKGADVTLALGVNFDAYDKAEHTVISNA